MAATTSDQRSPGGGATHLEARVPPRPERAAAARGARSGEVEGRSTTFIELTGGDLEGGRDENRPVGLGVVEGRPVVIGNGG